MIAALVALSLAQADVTFPNTEVKGESPRAWLTEVRLGSYFPWIDRPANCTPGSCPYQKAFNNGSMLLAELELERELFQKLGTASVGASLGYAEKFGTAVTSDGSQGESTGLRILPMKVLASYRFDWAAEKFGVPLVPYAKLAFQLVYWWTSKGSGTDVADGIPGVGWSYGVAGMLGLALQLDFLDPRLARDFDVGMGVNHTYLFAEYDVAEVNDFGRVAADGTTPYALDLSSRFFMFGLAFEY